MYTPEKTILKLYADILVKFALNSGEGVKRGEVVQCLVPDVAKPFLVELQNSILESGAHPLIRLLPTGLDKPFYKLANNDQLTFFPKKYLKARTDLIDHSIGVIAEHDLHELKDINPKKLFLSAESKKKVREWLNDKEYSGKFTWTLALYGTQAMADEAGLSLEEYWQQIIRACFLDHKNPISQWQKIFTEQERVKNRLNQMPIDRLHVKGKNIDLWLTLGEKRKWNGGSGRNIPSFEIFTSPDWRGTNGFIEFDQPLYRYGNLVTGIRLEFKNGRVIKATAKSGQKLITEMIKRPNADKVGEFSLTDSRASRITKFMANTLFDENIGGKYGNTHIAVGMSYKDAYSGDPSKLKKSDWKKLGFNDSGEHTDMISTKDRVVTAYLKGGSKKFIYKDGKFTL
jgi:aminopeptidase